MERICDQVPEGTILIVRNGWEKNLYQVSDLAFLNEIEMGQLFYAVAGYYGKTPEQYGARWVNFMSPQGTVSKAYRFIETELGKLKNDYLKLCLVCDQLGEDHIQAIETEQE